jgi:hypothetical protein
MYNSSHLLLLHKENTMTQYVIKHKVICEYVTDVSKSSRVITTSSHISQSKKFDTELQSNKFLHKYCTDEFIVTDYSNYNIY